MNSEQIITPPQELSKSLTLYKYISNKALEALIQHGDFRVTYPRDCNDPFERMPAYRKSSSSNNDGFISFSQCKDNATLWGNYAEKYAGALVKFDFTYFAPSGNDENDFDKYPILKVAETIKALGFDLFFLHAFEDSGRAKASGFRRYIIKCKYTDDNKRIDTRQCFHTDEEAEIDAKVNIYATLCTKGKDWAGEQEFRLPIREKDLTRCDFSSLPMFFTNIPTPYIKSIVLGPCSRYKASDITDMIRKRRLLPDTPKIYLPESINVTKAEMSDDSFSLMFEP